MTLSDLNQLLTARHSCRAFRPDPVPKEQIEQILTSAARVPSWCNAQPWHVVLTSGEETDHFREAMQNEAMTGAPAPDLPFPTSYSGVYQDRRRACGWALYAAVGVERGDRAASARQMMENFSLFGAPIARSSPVLQNLVLMARWTAAGSSQGFHWPHRRLVWPRSRRRHWPPTARSCAATSTSRTTG